MKALKNIVILVVIVVFVLGFVHICIADNLNMKIEESGNGAKLVLNHKGKKYELTLSPYSGNNAVRGTDVSAGTNAEEITLEQAKTIALNDAGLTNADFTKANKDFDDGIAVYEIEFIYDSKEYEYKIDSSSGRILDIDIEYNDKNYVNKNTGTGTGTTYNITSAEAESIALKSGGVSIGSVKYIHSYIDNDDGKIVYEVEFAVNNTKYEYKIDINNGTILEQDIDNH